jgi:5-(carboxyamino)imidazole ribonucleotide mutase
MQAKIIILMGSASDLPIVQKTAQTLDDFGVPFEVHILSAHRTPQETAELTQNAAQRGIEVIIAAAGMAAHLAGAAAANTTLPVIGIPIAATLGGIDALLATAQMPPGIPVATVGIDGAINAAILAVQILATHDTALQQRLTAHRTAQRQKILASASEIDKLDLPMRTNIKHDIKHDTKRDIK